MTHNTPESSSQTSHNGLTKLGIASDSGSANKALQPGTPILLQGCMCQEGDGVIVIKVNWRDKTYTGSLMDMEQHPWAAAKHIEITELGSPLEKELRFSQEFKMCQTKNNTGHESEQDSKEDDIVMSPLSSEMVESEGGKSPVSKLVLPKLNICTDLGRMNSNAMEVDEKRLFPSRSKQSLLISPSTSLTDLRAENDKKKNHEHHHTGLSHPKEVISTLLGEHCVLPFDTPTKDKIKQEIDTNHDMKEEINAMRRPPGVLLATKHNDHTTNHKEGLNHMPIMPSIYNAAVLNYPPFAQHIDFRPKIDPLIHTLNSKPITVDKSMQEFPPISDSIIVAKHETISPKSIAPESPNAQRLLQKKRRVENSDGNPLPKRPETLGIANMLPFYPPEGLKPLFDEAAFSKLTHHNVISKSASHPQPTLSPSLSQPAKPQTIHERKQYTTSPEISLKDGGLPNKLYEKEKQGFSTPNIPPHLTTNRGDKMRQEKKTKRGREGGSPKDHNSEGHAKSSFIPPSADSKIPIYMNQIKTETPGAFISPDMYHNYLSYPQVYQLLPGMTGMTPDQQNMLQHGIISMAEVKTEPEKSKPKSQATHKVKPAKQPQTPVTNYNHNLAQQAFNNQIAIMMNNGQTFPVVSKDGTAGLTFPGLPTMMVNSTEKDKMKHQAFPHSALHSANKTKIPTTTSLNSRKLTEKSTNHGISQEEVTTQSNQLGPECYNKVPPHLLAKSDMNSHAPDQNSINLPQSYKQKNAVSTSTNNIKVPATPNPQLLALPQPPKMPNGGFVPPLFPLYMTPEILQQMSTMNFPIPFDPAVYSLIDPTGAMRSFVQPQPDLDSK